MLINEQRTLATLIWLVVRVPVLSEQIPFVQPRVSTLGRLRTIAFFWAIFFVPSARHAVMTATRPSGCNALPVQVLPNALLGALPYLRSLAFRAHWLCAGDCYGWEFLSGLLHFVAAPPPGLGLGHEQARAHALPCLVELVLESVNFGPYLPLSRFLPSPPQSQHDDDSPLVTGLDVLVRFLLYRERAGARLRRLAIHNCFSTAPEVLEDELQRSA